MATLSEPIEVWPGADLEFTLIRLAGTQVVTLTGATGGTFTLTYRGATTAAIAYNASAATVQARLEALSTIKQGRVTVTGSAGGPWTVTPADDLAADDWTNNPMAATVTALTGTTPSAAITTPVLDISSGYDYAMQARITAGSPTADISITTTAGTDGQITLNGTAGEITLTVKRATTAALPAALAAVPASNSTLYFVVMEIVSTVYTELADGRMHVNGAYFI